MFESKYSKVLTVILIIIIIAIIGLLAFLGYDYYQKYVVTQEASDFVENFQGEFTEEEQEGNLEGENSNSIDNNNNNNTDAFNQIQDAVINNNNGSSSGKKNTYKGFVTLGIIEIPKINLKYPVLEKPTIKAIETSVARLFPTTGELNEPNNVVIIGHNYRNGLFFSNNKKLQIGDKIYITDNSGKKITYTIYNKFETTPEDTSFYQRDTSGKPEITLSTCTDDSKARLIILAKAD